MKPRPRQSPRGNPRPPQERPTPSNVVLTPRERDDTAFILDSWARSYRVSETCEDIPSSAFHRWHRNRMLAILDRATALVARDRENPGYIFGYGLFERVGHRFVAHWVYVKRDEWSQGIARLLLAAALHRLGEGATELVATHRTYIADKARELGFVQAKLTDLEPYRDVDKGNRSCA